MFFVSTLGLYRLPLLLPLLPLSLPFFSLLQEGLPVFRPFFFSIFHPAFYATLDLLLFRQVIIVANVKTTHYISLDPQETQGYRHPQHVTIRHEKGKNKKNQTQNNGGAVASHSCKYYPCVQQQFSSQ